MADPALAASGRMAGELNGDERLGAVDRLRYLALNLGRNLSGGCPGLAVRPWYPPAEALSPDGFGTASPGRALTEAFIRHRLPKLMPPGEVDVLDVGCGSGRTSGLLARAGYRGRYSGIDIADRFEARKWAGDSFETRFIMGDAHLVDISGPFDLVISISALEHVPDDGRLIERLDGLLACNGIQIHFVPAPAALFAYLWHGYRQYGRAAIARRFGTKDTQVYKLGGIAGLCLHLLTITFPELFLRISLRQRWPGAYKALLAACLRFDASFPACPLSYAVCRRRFG